MSFVISPFPLPFQKPKPERRYEGEIQRRKDGGEEEDEALNRSLERVLGILGPLRFCVL